MIEDQALDRMAKPLGEVAQALLEKGADRDAVNDVFKAILPLVNHALRLDARLTRLEREMRTRRQIGEDPGDLGEL